MRAFAVPFCFATATLLLAAAPGRAFAQAGDESTPVYDFGDAGGVVVVDTGSSAASQAQAQTQAQQRGSLTVLQNGAPVGQDNVFWFYGPHPDPEGAWDAT